jgi:formate-dependent nitrite reductase cytochrome c552 subunit
MRRPAQKSALVFCAGLFFVIRPSPVGAAGAPSSCVRCHRTIAGVNYLEHDFSDWAKSVHAKAGISCEACHGGNPSAQNARDAHQGMKPSTDPSSPVYFTRVPATCGTCHQAEFKAFQKSAHYKELQRTGRGPNCVSCHGSMANRILAPRDLEVSCNLCHKKPTQASATMMALANAGSSLEKLKKALDDARARHVDVSSQEKAYADAKSLHQRALEDWHTFKVAEVLAASQDITKRATTALNEVHLKEQQKSP